MLKLWETMLGNSPFRPVGFKECEIQSGQNLLVDLSLRAVQKVHQLPLRLLQHLLSHVHCKSKKYLSSTSKYECFSLKEEKTKQLMEMLNFGLHFEQ